MFPAPGASARRLGQDLWVVVTSPLQLPLVAGRESWEWCGEEGRSRLWVPFVFVGELVIHGGLAALHGVDIVATPVHFIAGNGPAEVYDGFGLPLERTDAPLGPAAGVLLLWGAAGTAGAVIAWWFGSTYVPHLFHWFTGS
jgi:hypothetical protein